MDLHKRWVFNSLPLRASKGLLLGALFLCALSFLGLSTEARTLSAQQDVVVVNAGDSLKAAVDGAAPGSVLLIKEGDYFENVTIQDGLVLVADTGARVFVQSILVDSLPSGGSVLLRGLESGFDFDYFTTAGLYIRNCQGTVEVEDCQFYGSRDNAFIDPNFVRVEGSSRVLILGSTLRGGAESTFSTAGSGLLLSNSSLYAFKSVFEGAHSAGGPLSLDGASGLRLDNSFGFAQDCGIVGGDGYFTFDPFGCGPAGSGGPGAELIGSASANLRNGSLQGGLAAVPPCGGGVVGSDGPAYVGAAANLLQLNAAVADLQISPSPIRSGSKAQVSLAGLPGQRVLVYASQVPGAIYLPKYFGVWALGAPAFFLGSVVLDGSGTGVLSTSANLTGGVQASTFIVQALYLATTPGTSLALGNPTSVVIVDASF